MKRRPGGLGRGLDALFPARPAGTPGPSTPSHPEGSAPGASAPPVAGAVELPVEAITPNPTQPRARIAPEELADLAASVRTHGVLQPLIVSRAETGYVLIAGERRWRAAQLAGLATVPVMVKDVTPRERLELALVENVQRQDLTPLEEAAAYRQLMSEHGLTQEGVATRVGKSRVAVANALRLLHLAPAVHAALTEGRISAGHARALLGAPDATVQETLLARVLAEDLSVRATEEAVRRGSASSPHPALGENQTAPLRTARPDAEQDEQRTALPVPELGEPRGGPRSESRATTRRPPRPASTDVAAVEQELRMALRTKVQLYHSRRGGRIVIHYFSDDELQGLYERLTGHG